MQTGFPGLCFGQMGQARWALLTAFFVFLHQYWFMNSVILPVDQWLKACAVVSSGNFRISGRTRLLLGPNQESVFLSSQQLFNFQHCFSFSGASCWAFLVSVSKLSSGGCGDIPLERDRGLAIGSFESSIFRQKCQQGGFL